MRRISRPVGTKFAILNRCCPRCGRRAAVALSSTSRALRDKRERTMTKGSDLLVAALENEGVDRIFGVPGEENLDVVESLRTPRSSWC